MKSQQATDPLFCLEFVEIANKIETAGDFKARERKGVALGKDNFFFAPALRPPSRSALALAHSKKNNSLQKINVRRQTNYLRFCSHKVLNRIKSFTILIQITASIFNLRYFDLILRILFLEVHVVQKKINWANKDAAVVIADQQQKEAPINSAYLVVKKAQRKWPKCIQYFETKRATGTQVSTVK